MQYAGGILRPPVQKLVASIRFAPQRGKSAIESYIVHPNTAALSVNRASSITEPAPIKTPHAHGILQPPVQKLVASIRFAPWRGKSVIESYIVHPNTAALSVSRASSITEPAPSKTPHASGILQPPADKTGGIYTICPPQRGKSAIESYIVPPSTASLPVGLCFFYHSPHPIPLDKPHCKW